MAKFINSATFLTLQSLTISLIVQSQTNPELCERLGKF